ncbi:hypothetical protein BGW80DRAFT_1162355 [Lactifluus volemus]|nr:hypothetical protein BGW80DRAFT_1162355 [Lactifluus volemus]
MVVFFLTFSSILLIIGSACAQITAPNCTVTVFPWMSNSLGQSPCLVAAYLAAVCNNGAFDIPPLLPGNSYHGPNGPDDTDLCKCNTVVFNLISACDACQGSPWTTYSAWSYNCTTKATAGTYPSGVPVGVQVPKWAYAADSVIDDWNITEAELIGGAQFRSRIASSMYSQHFTGTASFASATTKASTPTVTPASGSSSTGSPSSKSNSNTGAIAGGVVGGVAAASIVAAVVAWFVIRRRRAQAAPSTAFRGDKNSDMGHIAEPFPLSFEAPQRLYDPSDPSTYPLPQAPSPTIRTTGTTAPSNPYQGSLSDVQSNRQAYSGLPEV